MNCPKCGAAKNLVLESRKRPDYTRRRRECSSCNHRWSTAELDIEFYERLLALQDMVE